MVTIWDEKIQKLVLSHDIRNIKLAASLIDDINELVVWYWMCDPKDVKDYDLPLLPAINDLGHYLNNCTGRIPVGNKYKYLKKAYDRYLESKNTTVDA